MRWLLIVLCLPIGGIVGYLAHRPPAIASSPVTDRVCVAEAEATSDCGVVSLSTRWCEARLATLDTSSRLALVPRPVRDGYSEAVVDAFRSCGVPAVPVAVDCREPPCVVSAAIDDPEAVAAAIEACPELRALGFDPAPVQRWPVQCPDGTVSDMGFVVAGADLDSVAEALVPKEIADSDELGAAILAGYYAGGQIGRRADQLARSWPCE